MTRTINHEPASSRRRAGVQQTSLAPDRLDSPGSIERPATRRMLPDSVGYLLAAAAIGLSLFSSVTLTPLYGLYAERWHFGAVTLTLVYAAYALGVLATLLLAGRVSDYVGRRPMLLCAMTILIASTVVFMVSDSAIWLAVGRALQGVAIGLSLSTGSALLLDLNRRDPVGIGRTNGVASTMGIGLGVLISSALVQIGAAPRELPFVVLLVLGVIGFAGAYWMREPVLERSRFRLTFERPKVPAEVRQPFLLASLAVIASYTIGGLFFSIGPELAAHLFSTTNVILSGIGIVALAGSATLSQLLLGRSAPWIGLTAGSVALAAGMLLIVLATAVDSSVAYVAGSAVSGAGFGIALLGGLRALSAAIPNEQRAATMAAFYIVAYASLSVPAVLAGVLVTPLGLISTFEIFGSVVAAVALIVAVGAWRTRPARQGQRTG